MWNNRSGFTLVELIVVIIIVGVLAAVATPMMQVNVARAQRTEAVAALGSIRTAERLIFAETGAYVAVAAGSWAATDPLGRYILAIDLTGRIYQPANYSVTIAGGGFVATATNPPGGPGLVTINELGAFTGN